MKRKMISIVLLIATVLSTLSVATAAEKEPFSDVRSGDWFSQYVIYVYENELMNGMSAEKFEPNGTCTRAMAATVLYRIAGSPSVSGSASFNDLSAQWYKNAVAWAEKEKVVNGVGGGKFAPNGLVTREQLLTMIWRFAGEPSPANAKGLNQFPDANKVSSYAKTAFNWGIENGIINGKDGKLAPSGNATRAEFAKIITVFDQTVTVCAHAWDAGRVTLEATCTENGTKTYTCSKCGKTKTETIDALGHDYYTGACNRCGERESFNAWYNVYDAHFASNGHDCWHIPEIQTYAGNTDDLNVQIYNELYDDYAKNVLQSYDPQHPELIEMCYRYAGNNQFLSVIVKEEWNYDYRNYFIYNMNLESGELISDRELIESYMPESDFRALVRSKMKAKFEQEWSMASGGSFYDMLLEETISDSNVANASPFIDENGDLCVVALIYSPVGAGEYYELINVTGNTSVTPLECNVAHWDTTQPGW